MCQNLSNRELTESKTHSSHVFMRNSMIFFVKINQNLAHITKFTFPHDSQMRKRLEDHRYKPILNPLNSTSQ
jgi:hypothetical protein